MAALFGNLLAGSPPAALGVRDGRLAPCPASPNCVSSQATDADHRVAPIAYTGDAAAALVRLAHMIAAQPGATIVAQHDGYIYATFQTPLMGFVDDVEFLVDPAQRVIQVRSASRLGTSDFGVNRKRIEALRAALAKGAP
jgi:uncharacterized protein (DUF1499 family)